MAARCHVAKSIQGGGKRNVYSWVCSVCGVIYPYKFMASDCCNDKKEEY